MDPRAGTPYASSRFIPWGPVSAEVPAAHGPRPVQEPSELVSLVCGVCGLKLDFWGRSTHGDRRSTGEIWVFGCHDRHQAWEYDPGAGRWWLKEDSNPVST